MSNAIPTNTHAVNGPNAASAGASADWLHRLGGNPGQDNSGATSFARWMAQHSPQAPVSAQPQATSTATLPPARPTAQPSAPAQPNKATSPRTVAQAKAPDTSAPATSTTGAAASGRAAQAQAQAQVQARADAAKTARQAQTERTQQADANRQAKGAQGAAKLEQAKGTGGAGGAEGSQNTEATRGTDDPDDTRFATAQGEGAALVRELTPPPTVQAGDPASMMAWLASLTQAGAEPGAAEAATPGGDGLADAAEASRGLGRDGAVGRDGRDGRAVASGLGWRGRESGQEAGAGKGGAAGDASLQADALLGRGREALALQDEGLGKGGIDVSALLAADGGRVASFGQALSAAKEALPHARATLPTPLDAPEFSQKLADQVSLWVGQSRSDGPMTAELHLNPVEMGPIHVKISLDGQSAQVDFAAAALETRQAIEASLSALSSSLEDAGLSLSGGNVFSQTPQQQQEARQRFGSDPARAGQRSGGANGPSGEGEALGLRQVSAPRSSRLGGLDLYA